MWRTPTSSSVAVWRAAALLAVGGIVLGWLLLEGRPTVWAVPVPDNKDSNSSKDPMASKPVLKDGLEIIIRPTQGVLWVKERPNIKITYTNRSKRVFSIAYLRSPGICTWTDSKGVTWRWDPPKELQSTPRCVTLEPGSSYTDDFPGYDFTRVEASQIHSPRLPAETSRDAAPPRVVKGPPIPAPLIRSPHLPAETYTVTIKITLRAWKERWPDLDFWVGEVDSHPVRVTIVDAEKR
ncbi:MAG: hypothetical protein NZ700_09600 [Gemmataceae bacterium]|nr:hypothetical protein [Gemmataceae bacterium]